MCNVNYHKFPWSLCGKNVYDKDKTVQCDLCEFWIHIKCNNLNCYLDYRYLQNCDEFCYCIEFCCTIFSFNSLPNNENVLACCSSSDSDSNFMQLKELRNDHNSSLLVNEFNNATLENNNDLEENVHLNIMTSMKCIILKYLTEIDHYLYAKCMFFNKNFDDLQHQLSPTKKVFEIITISETRIAKDVSLLNNLNLSSYSFKFIPTETSAGDTFPLYCVSSMV